MIALGAATYCRFKRSGKRRLEAIPRVLRRSTASVGRAQGTRRPARQVGRHPRSRIAACLGGRFLRSPRQAALLADMATIDFRAGRVEDAAACYCQLARQYADVPCRGKLTPAAWLAALPDGDALRKEIARPALRGQRAKSRSARAPIRNPSPNADCGSTLFGKDQQVHFSAITRSTSSKNSRRSAFATARDI